MTIEWIPEPSDLGLFSETTAAEGLASVANKDACYAAVIAMGASGWNLILAPVFQDICLQEACGKGIILTPHEMQKVGAIVGTCMQKCVDDANTLTDATARKAALAACPATCNLVTVMESVQQTPPPPPPKKSNAVWWVLGGLAVLVGGYALVKGAGSVGAVLGNPIPKKTLEELEEEAKNRIWEEGEGVGFEGGEPSEQDWQMVYETMGRLVESDEMTEEERAILREALRMRANPGRAQVSTFRFSLGQYADERVDLFEVRGETLARWTARGRQPVTFVPTPGQVRAIRKNFGEIVVFPKQIDRVHEIMSGR